MTTKLSRFASLPTIEGELDAAYLKAALARAGRADPVERLEITELTDGRQSNKVMSLKTGVGAYVVKTFPIPNWRDGIFGEGRGEVALWLSGATRDLAPVRCPTIDIAHSTTRNEEWMLMDNVSRGIMPRGTYDEEKLKWLLRALASLHARFWQKDGLLAGLPVIPLETHVTYLAEPIAAIGGRVPIEGWIKDTLENVTVLKPLVPPFLELLGRDAELYLDLCVDRDAWLRKLGEGPMTLTHGDVRRANVAPLFSDEVAFFDWDMSSVAPAATDLAWFWFLHFWCYPPDAVRIEDREPLREFYIEELATRVGEKFDRADFDRSWELSWLKAFVELGFCLADPIVSPNDANEIGAAQQRLTRAIEEAKRISTKHRIH